MDVATLGDIVGRLIGLAILAAVTCLLVLPDRQTSDDAIPERADITPSSAAIDDDTDGRIGADASGMESAGLNDQRAVIDDAAQAEQRP